MKVNYTWIIIIIIVIFIVNNYLNKNKDIERLGGDPINKLTKGIQNLMDKLLKNEEEQISIISNQYHQEINTKPFDLKKDFISPNPEGSTEFRFVEENPKTAWSTVNVSQHPEYYTSNFEDEKVDTSGFFNQDQFFHDNTSPNSQTNLPERCTVNGNNEVHCNYNNRLQLIPPKLIMDSENNLVLNSIGQGKGDIFKTVDSSNVNNVNGGSYQVWNYENEKMINGGTYFKNVVASDSKNEMFMELGETKTNYSF